MSNTSPAQIVDAPIYSREHGEFLPGKAARLAEILRDYNPYLELRFVPTSKRDDSDTHPFAIWDTSPWRSRGGEGYPVRHLTEREMENPQAILAWLFEGDLSKRGVSEIMAREEARKTAEKVMRAKESMDEAEARQELAAAIMTGGRDKKNAYRHNGKIFTDRGKRNVSKAIH